MSFAYPAELIARVQVTNLGKNLYIFSCGAGLLCTYSNPPWKSGDLMNTSDNSFSVPREWLDDP